MTRGPVHSSWVVAGFLSLLRGLPVDAPVCLFIHVRGAGGILVWSLMQNAAMDTLVTGFGVRESHFFGSVFFPPGLLIVVKYT